MLSARAREIAGTFDEADQRLVARAIETASALAARAGDILRNFDDADQRLSTRIGESAEALAARAAELGAHLRRGRRAARDPHLGRATRRSAPAPAKSSASSSRPTSVWRPASPSEHRRRSASRPRAIDLANVFEADDRLADASPKRQRPAGESCRGAGRRRALATSPACSTKPTQMLVGRALEATVCRRVRRNRARQRRRRLPRTADIAGVFSEAEQQIIARTHQTSAELAERAQAIEEALASRGRAHGRGRASGCRTGRQPGRRSRAAAGLQRRIDGARRSTSRSRRPRPSSSRAPTSSPRPSRRSASISARAPTTRPGRSASTRASSTPCSPPAPPRSPRSSTRPRGRWSTASPTAAASLQKSLEAATQQATERLRTENAALVNALANRTAETLAAVEGARTTLSEGVTDLIDRLSASSSQLNDADRSGQAEPAQRRRAAVGHAPTSSPRPPRRRRRPSPARRA